MNGLNKKYFTDNVVKVELSVKALYVRIVLVVVGIVMWNNLMTVLFGMDSLLAAAIFVVGAIVILRQFVKKHLIVLSARSAGESV